MTREGDCSSVLVTKKFFRDGFKYYFRCGCINGLSINNISRFSISNLEKLQKERCLRRIIHFIRIVIIVLFNLDNTCVLQRGLDYGCGVCTRHTFYWYYSMPDIFLSKKPLKISKAFYFPPSITLRTYHPKCACLRRQGANFLALFFKVFFVP